MKEAIDNALSDFNSIKLESEKKAKDFVKENKSSAFIGCITLIGVSVIVIGVIWFLYSIF